MLKAEIVTWMLVITFIVCYNLWNMRYWASYPATLYYASSIDNIHSVYCFDLKYETNKVWKDNIFKNWNNTEQIASESELNSLAWKCVNSILGKIDTLNMNDFDKLWFWNGWDNNVIKKESETKKKWIISWTFFAAEKMSAKETLSWSISDIFVLSQMKDALDLWRKSDYRSYGSCKALVEDKFPNEKDSQSDFLVDYCFDNIHRYLILSVTKFSKRF